jgi:ABC-2 type transport system ATP-binding protein
MHAISFESVGKDYPAPQGNVLKALDNVSFDIEEGEFFGLLGPNGAGKTTLIQILGTLCYPTRGRVAVRGIDVGSQGDLARRQIGVVPQELVFDPFFTVREALRIQSGYFGLCKNDAWIDELLENLGLTEKADVNMRRLSGGMKRRVMVAQALVHKPPVIVLDEPTAGVDVELRQSLWQFVSRLHQQGHTILLTTHYLEEAQALCKRIAMLKQGRVIALNTTEALLEKSSEFVLSMSLEGTLPTVLINQARSVGGKVEFVAKNAGEVENILSALRQAQVGVRDLEIHKPNLEDVFLRLMGNGAENSGD